MNIELSAQSNHPFSQLEEDCQGKTDMPALSVMDFPLKLPGNVAGSPYVVLGGVGGTIYALVVKKNLTLISKKLNGYKKTDGYVVVWLSGGVCMLWAAHPGIVQ